MHKVCAKFQTTLAAGISASATTAVLSSAATGDNDSSTLPAGNYGFVIDEGNANEEYAIATVSGVNLTFVSRGLAYYDGDTEKALNKKAHRKGASIKITDHPVIARIVRALNGDEALENVPKLPSVRTINDSRHLVDKEYADAISAAGITAMLVIDNGGTQININSGRYILNGSVEEYAGASGESLTDDDTNYIQIKDGALDINTSGFDDDAIPLAIAICASGDITSLTDCRPFYTAVDIKANYGLGRDSNGIYVDLDTGGGMKFNSGKLALDIVGAVIPFAGASAPTGWLICDGSAVSRSTYAALFAIVGETYGNGDGSTTFNLPNLKGKIPVGKNASDSDFDALGETGGEKTHTLTTDEIPAHSHAIPGDNDGGSSTYVYLNGNTGNENALGNTGNAGGGSAHNNLQPYIVLNYIIKY